MTHTRIHFSPPQPPEPQSATLPLDNARRWVSPYEESGTVAPVPVFFAQSAYSRAVVHAASESDIEVGGILVGKWCADVEACRQFIVVVAALPARFTQQGNVFLTFTQDSLVDIHAQIDESYPGKEIVGWYHTHPRMGVFLSHYDTWLHDHFFPEPWQVALVIEPHTAIGGFFIRKEDGVLDPSRYFGFYELEGESGRSVVRWNNLQEEADEAENKGVDRNE
ncbi:MAG TPA: Mov34/MPN/PAD-1 family protein [Anaerolineales bacterium]|nr:Mov34/MPN/PAD-1 family protein [Anaerolineales bacterium]